MLLHVLLTHDKFLLQAATGQELNEVVIGTAVTERHNGCMGWPPTDSAIKLSPLILDWGSASKLSLVENFLHSLQIPM